MAPSSPECNFGMWWSRRLTSWMCSGQICSSCDMLSCQFPAHHRICFAFIIKAILKKKKGGGGVQKGVPNKVANEYIVMVIS